MKRGFSLLAGALTVLLAMFAAGSCRQAKPVRVEGKINVTSVIFPSFDFVRVIAGDRVNLIMLLPQGAESHSYEPRPMDIITIKESDLFIYPGGENAVWVDRILESLEVSTEKMKVLKLLDLVDAVEEEIVEGMQDDDNGDHEEEHDEDSPDFDEHVWTSPGNAKIIVAAITDALCELDSVNAEFYRQNAADYFARLDELDASFREVVNGAKRKTIVFGDRFPFRYLADAYGLTYSAAFPGCSTETEPSAATVAFLINKVRNENIPVVFHIELSNEKIADTISEATGAKKLMLHSGHNVTKKDFESGANYLDIQKANVENLREALW
jgi:zinc transport system substrate-binding protein